MASELSETVSRIVILSKARLSQHRIVARLKVSKGVVHGALCFAETGSALSKVWPERLKRDRKRISSQIENLLHKEYKTLKEYITNALSCFSAYGLCVQTHENPDCQNVSLLNHIPYKSKVM